MVTGFLSLLRHRKGLRAHYSVSEDEDDDGFTAYNYSTIVSQKGDGCFLRAGAQQNY